MPQDAQLQRDALTEAGCGRIFEEKVSTYAGTAAATRASQVIRRTTNRGHLSGDHPGRVAGTATVLLPATDEIAGTRRDDQACRQRTFGPWRLLSACPIVEGEMIKMSVLVVYASKHGATRGIAGRIAAGLRTAGCQADVRPVQDAGDLAGYDAFVIGSAAYELHWRKEATEFVRRNAKVLAARPVWLFSSGPLGTGPADAKGRDLCAVTVPKEIPEFTQALHPRGHRVFFGALDAAKLTFAERSLRKLPAARAALPEGDFRDWPEIDDWAAGIARELATAP